MESKVQDVSNPTIPRLIKLGDNYMKYSGEIALQYETEYCMILTNHANIGDFIGSILLLGSIDYTVLPKETQLTLVQT